MTVRYVAGSMSERYSYSGPREISLEQVLLETPQDFAGTNAAASLGKSQGNVYYCLARFSIPYFYPGVATAKYARVRFSL